MLDETVDVLFNGKTQLTLGRELKSIRLNDFVDSGIEITAATVKEGLPRYLNNSLKQTIVYNGKTKPSYTFMVLSSGKK